MEDMICLYDSERYCVTEGVDCRNCKIGQTKRYAYSGKIVNGIECRFEFEEEVAERRKTIDNS